MKWFSSKVRVVCLVEPEGAQRYMDSVYVFKADDFETAFQRAVDLGKEQEEEYLNAENQIVRWRLKEVISLDVINHTSLDGAEVYSEPVELEVGARLPFDADFQPEKSLPTQTV